MTALMKAADRGRAARLALLLLVTVFCLWLAVPVIAQEKSPGQAKNSAGWWLQVVGPDSKLLVSFPVPDGAGWCLAWNHSVEGFTVHDCYRNQAGQMLLERSHLPDFAAGLDHIPGRGRQVSDGQGGYWIEELNEPVAGGRYRLRVGSDKVNHRLVSHGQPTLSYLIEQQGAESADCPLLAPGVNLKTPGRNTPTVISLSELAADCGVTVQLTGSTSCDRNKNSASESPATTRSSP